MKLDLIGKTALVTASSGGIGLEIARSLAAEGASVVINGRMQISVEQAVADIRAGLPNAKLTTLVADNGTAAGCGHTISPLPDVDILVNNLGIYEAVGFFDETDEAWHEIFDINIMSGPPRASLLPRHAGAWSRSGGIHFKRIWYFSSSRNGSLQRPKPCS